MATITMSPNKGRRTHQVYRDGTMIGEVSDTYLRNYVSDHLPRYQGSMMNKAPGQAYAELKAQAIILMQRHNAANLAKPMRYDEALLKVVQRPANSSLCKQWQEELGFVRVREDEENEEDRE
jgi:hypothetical protein